MRSNTKAFYNIHAVEKLDLKTSRTRLPFIDFARGFVMILMAWDHVSGFWNHGHRGSEGLLIVRAGIDQSFLLRPDFANFTQFLARFVTHWCAPTFIFLAGTALALSTIKNLTLFILIGIFMSGLDSIGRWLLKQMRRVFPKK